MRYGMTILLVAAVGLLSAGCSKKNKQATAEAPPPEPEFIETQPIVVAESTPAPQPVEVAIAPVNDTAQPQPVYNTFNINSNARSHTVRRGDTLWSIARQAYGDGKRWSDIAQANGIGDPTKLRIGQQLMLP